MCIVSLAGYLLTVLVSQDYGGSFSDITSQIWIPAGLLLITSVVAHSNKWWWIANVTLPSCQRLSNGTLLSSVVVVGYTQDCTFDMSRDCSRLTGCDL